MRMVRGITLRLAATILVACGPHTEVEPVGVAIQGHVLDADTFEPIPDALVFGYYIGTGGHSGGGSSCYYGETVSSGLSGEFSMPVDPTPGLGRPILGAYKPGYFFVFPPRYSICDSNGRNCETYVGHWNNDRVMDRYYVEATKYPSRAEALVATREEIDTYLKNAAGWTREQKLFELRRRRPICTKPGKITDGSITLNKAILNEQVELGASSSEIEFTRMLINEAEQRR